MAGGILKSQGYAEEEGEGKRAGEGDGGGGEGGREVCGGLGEGQTT